MSTTNNPETNSILTREDVRQIVLEELSKLGDILLLIDAAKEAQLTQEESTNG